MLFNACDNTQNHHWITRMLHQKFLGYTNSCLFILLSRLFGDPSSTYFCVTLSGKIALYGCVGKLQHYIHLSTDFKFYESWTYGHIRELRATHVSFHQSKHHSVDLFFHHCECFTASLYRIRVPTLYSVLASCLHHTHFVATSVWPDTERFSVARKVHIKVHTSHLPDTHLRGSSMFILE